MAKAPNYDRYAGIVSIPDPLNPRKPRPFRVDEDGHVIYLDKELDAVRSLGGEKPIRLAELGNSNWNGYEAMRAQGERDGRVLREAVKAGSSFSRNYADMRDANTIGADKYFHCKANCEASSLGDTGESVARTISNGREIVDQRLKGDPRSASLADQRANVAGRSAGRRIREGRSEAHQCTAACDHFRPNGLSKRY
jgi:hypothetical protein